MPAVTGCDRTFPKSISANLPGFKNSHHVSWEKIPVNTVGDSSTHESDRTVSLENDSVSKK